MTLQTFWLLYHYDDWQLNDGVFLISEFFRSHSWSLWVCREYGMGMWNPGVVESVSHISFSWIFNTWMSHHVGRSLVRRVKRHDRWSPGYQASNGWNNNKPANLRQIGPVRGLCDNRCSMSWWSWRWFIRSSSKIKTVTTCTTSCRRRQHLCWSSH